MHAISEWLAHALESYRERKRTEKRPVQSKTNARHLAAGCTPRQYLCQESKSGEKNETSKWDYERRHESWHVREEICEKVTWDKLLIYFHLRLFSFHLFFSRHSFPPIQYPLSGWLWAQEQRSELSILLCRRDRDVTIKMALTFHWEL